MPGHRILLVVPQRTVTHAGEIVVGGVVFLDVFETEPEELALEITSLGRAEFTFALAAGMLATRTLTRTHLFRLRLGADLVKKGRIEIHHQAVFKGGDHSPARASNAKLALAGLAAQHQTLRKDIVMTATTRKARIEAALTALQPTYLDVIDDSAKHAGHAGARPEGETHYTIRIIAPTFAGKSRVATHREINALLKDEFASGLHALAIEARGS